MKLVMRFSFEELVIHSGVDSDLVLRFYSNEWISPVDGESMIFDEEDVARVRLIYELQHLMGVNDEGIPVILHLVDQLNCMHIEMKLVLDGALRPDE